MWVGHCEWPATRSSHLATGTGRTLPISLLSSWTGSRTAILSSLFRKPRTAGKKVKSCTEWWRHCYHGNTMMRWCDEMTQMRMLLTGVTAFAIGVGPPSSERTDELTAIALNTSFLFQTPAFSGLQSFSQPLVDMLCQSVSGSCSINTTTRDKFVTLLKYWLTDSLSIY